MHDAKLKLQAEFKEKQKNAETQRRIQRAVVSSEVRMKKMLARDELVQKVKTQALQRVASKATADPQAYAALLLKLVVQGLLKLNESVVEVQCREADAKYVQAVLDRAARQYEQMIMEACKEAVKVTLTLSNKWLPPAPKAPGAEGCSGGVKLTALNGRIVCDNTLDSRLEIAFADLTPTIRKMLFSGPL